MSEGVFGSSRSYDTVEGAILSGTLSARAINIKYYFKHQVFHAHCIATSLLDDCRDENKVPLARCLISMCSNPSSNAGPSCGSQSCCAAIYLP
jgi:hypothetical protein